MFPFLFIVLLEETLIDKTWARSGCGIGAQGCVSQAEPVAPYPVLPEHSRTKDDRPPFVPKQWGNSPPCSGAEILNHDTALILECREGLFLLWIFLTPALGVFLYTLKCIIGSQKMQQKMVLWWNQGWSHARRCYLECPACKVYVKLSSNFLIIDIWCELELANDMNFLAGKNMM